jgi:DNA-binding NarL/FixJ family response regulator
MVAQKGDGEVQQSGKLTVVIAHQDPFVSAGLACHLTHIAEFAPVVCGLELDTAIARSDTVGVVVADYDSGLRLLAPNSRWRDCIVIFTERDSAASICHALQQGVRGYLLVGCGVADVADAIRTVHQGGCALAPLVASRLAAQTKDEKLTPSELDILLRLSFGFRNKEIARATSRTMETVKTHVKTIFRKLNARNRTQAVMIARQRGLLPKDVGDCLPPQANSYARAVAGRGIPVQRPSLRTVSFDYYPTRPVI